MDLQEYVPGGMYIVAPPLIAQEEKAFSIAGAISVALSATAP